MDVFEGENKQYRKQLTKLGGNKVLRRRPRAAIFDVSFATETLRLARYSTMA